MLSLSIILRSRSLLKISACVIAYVLWSLLSDAFMIDFTCKIPLYLKANSQLMVKKAPSSLFITLRGLRKHIRSLNLAALSAQIPCDFAEPGTYPLEISRNMLHLPSSIVLTNYSPAPCMVTLGLTNSCQ